MLDYSTIITTTTTATITTTATTAATTTTLSFHLKLAFELVDEFGVFLPLSLQDFIIRAILRKRTCFDDVTCIFL